MYILYSKVADSSKKWLILLRNQREKTDASKSPLLATKALSHLGVVTDYGHPERALFQNLKLLGLGIQIGLKFHEAFGVFLAKL